MIIFMSVAKYYLISAEPIERLVICCLAGAVIFSGGILLWPEMRKETVTMLQQVMDLWRRSSREQIS
jgi:hypothetical protein